MSHADHSECHAVRDFWRRWFSVAFIICLAACAALALHFINLYRDRAISNYKMSVIAAQAASISNVATVLMTERGVIIKSNAAADDMLLHGENAEGHNIHEFCINKAERDRAIKGMQAWYRASQPGSVKAITVMMRVPLGDVPVIVIATAVKKGAAGDIAFKADLIYASKFSYSNVLHNQPPPEQAR